MSNPEHFLIKDDIKSPTSKSQRDESISSSSSSNSHSQDKKEEINSRIIVLTKQGDNSDQSSSVLIPSSSSGEKIHKVEEDGFRTPTSMDHRISVPKECPPPPRKMKPSLKRKAPYNHCNCRHPLDLAKEVELLFPTTKKVRSQEPK